MLYHLRDQVSKFRQLLSSGGTITFDSVIGDGDLEKPQRLANQLSDAEPDGQRISFVVPLSG